MNTQSANSDVIRTKTPSQDGLHIGHMLDLPQLRRETGDVLHQLSANIQALEDLSGRLHFALIEIKSLVR